jgi:MFS transporter, MHS family, proline/betaine transporter
VSLSFNTFFIYLPSQLSTELRIPLPRALAGALLGLAVMAALSPALGRLSDRMGRKPLLVAATLSLLALTLPIYLLVRRGGPALALGYLLVGMVLSGFVLPSLLSELFPSRMRSSALAITYGVASALFGGTAPLVQTLLVQRTGNPLVPAWYATTVALAAVAALWLPETAFRPLDAEEPSVATRWPVAG